MFKETWYQPALVCAQIAFLFQLKPCKHATGILKQNTVYNSQNLFWINILKLKNRSHLNGYSKLLYKATQNHIKLLSLVYYIVLTRNCLNPNLGLCYFSSRKSFLTAKIVIFDSIDRFTVCNFHKNKHLTIWKTKMRIYSINQTLQLQILEGEVNIYLLAQQDLLNTSHRFTGPTFHDLLEEIIWNAKNMYHLNAQH